MRRLIHVQDLCKRYPSGSGDGDVLRGVSLEIDRGEIVAIVGRSGAGKTTLLNIIGALDTSFRGSVRVGDHDLAGAGDRELSEVRNRLVGFVFQTFHLLDHLTCLENVALPWVFSRDQGTMARGPARQRARELVEHVGLREREACRPGELSGGERQRVALARALFHRPAVLLCDELTGNLDRDTGKGILELLRRLHREHGMTLVIATHDTEIAGAADRVLVLRDGVIESPEGLAP